MMKLLGIAAIAMSLVGGANFAFLHAANAAANDPHDYGVQKDGCMYDGYPCSDWYRDDGW